MWPLCACALPLQASHQRSLVLYDMEADGGKESDEDSPESSAESGLDRSMKAVTGLCEALDRRVRRGGLGLRESIGCSLSDLGCLLDQYGG